MNAKMDGNGRHQKNKIKVKNTLVKHKKNNVKILLFDLLEKKTISALSLRATAWEN
jgi:hypothetical protein